MVEASQYDTAALLAEWRWLIPASQTPLFISAFGDWVFGQPNGSLWALSVLDGTYSQVAQNANEYNTLNKSAEWLDQTFIAGWLSIAAGNGMQPTKDECLGWKLHPRLGGKFEVANLQIFTMRVYQHLMGQLHQQLQPQLPKQKRSWFKLK